MELPLPKELNSLIQEHASDRVGVHPTARLIYSVRVFETHDKSKFKVVTTKHGEYFIVLRDGNMTKNIYRGYDIINY